MYCCLPFHATSGAVSGVSGGKVVVAAPTLEPDDESGAPASVSADAKALLGVVLAALLVTAALVVIGGPEASGMSGPELAHAPAVTTTTATAAIHLMGRKMLNEAHSSEQLDRSEVGQAAASLKVAVGLSTYDISDCLSIC